MNPKDDQPGAAASGQIGTEREREYHWLMTVEWIGAGGVRRESQSGRMIAKFGEVFTRRQALARATEVVRDTLCIPPNTRIAILLWEIAPQELP